ncbi:SMP-30/gluconolactonase/LRE family protein [Ruania halotolerans]|uniref:SMP-30/gluconolactonase/LRE family protein n=1 Tax=Ruania halotolerans TaxID=2897773 RepID=UPI001E4C3E76|nr:SMP-30/gluconolactonase/LRE family protein [Ruania halotolerans]UFU07035.1 SMP-30/gluconolactonase/LRE family protein [Ruania halotolerans]
MVEPFTESGAELRRLYTGSVWAEGPVWLPGPSAQGRVRWSDIPNNRILEHEVAAGRTRVYAKDAEYTNGRTLDRGGAVVQCSHGRRAVERDNPDSDASAPITLVDSWQGHRLNSPNDVVVASDGAIWFTDPPYGILSNKEGREAPQEYDGCYVFRLDEATGEVAAVITDMIYPNGLAFSPDESILYVSDTGDEAGHIRAYDVQRPDGGPPQCVNPRLFATVRPGAPDGFRVDTEGRIWTSAGDGVQIYSPSGDHLGLIEVPEKVSNVCFGGDDGHDLFITATTSLYTIRVTATEAPRPTV